MLDLPAAASAMHGQGMAMAEWPCLGDVQSPNILLREDTSAVIADVGLAEALSMTHFSEHNLR